MCQNHQNYKKITKEKGHLKINNKIVKLLLIKVSLITTPFVFIL